MQAKRIVVDLKPKTLDPADLPMSIADQSL
jgi:hypothetical protein